MQIGKQSKKMIRNVGMAALLAIAVTTSMAMPAHEAAAQGGALGGALLGGAAGAAVGGAIGGGRGAAAGAIIGATTGAVIGAEGERRQGGYYYWHRGCYIQRPDGAWIRVSPRYCGPY
jgi:outer membrane lipoprotein SlyB